MLTELDRSVALTEEEEALVRRMRNWRAGFAVAAIAYFLAVGLFRGPEAPGPSRASQDTVAPDRGLMALEYGRIA